jgi:uncharacterized membrane protein (UPF0127 family)
MENGYLYIQDYIFPTLLAISSEEQSQGLMYQSWPPPIMSFVYSSPRINQFWMKNTPSPLDIVFCHNGKIKQICKGEPYSTATIGDYTPSDLVIEFPYGTIKQSNIKLGTSVGLVKPNQNELKKIFAEKYSHFHKK